MTFSAVAFVSLLLAGGSAELRPGVHLTGMIQFPRAQAMTIEADPRDGSRFTARMGFDGRCRGGGLGELWASNVLARPLVRVRDGRFDASLRGTVRDIGQVRGRTGELSWRLTGRVVSGDLVRATVDGSALVRGRAGRVLSRCRIASPASVRLTVPSRDR